jgi:hypothetical protein
MPTVGKSRRVSDDVWNAIPDDCAIPTSKRQQDINLLVMQVRCPSFFVASTWVVWSSWRLNGLTCVRVCVCVSVCPCVWCCHWKTSTPFTHSPTITQSIYALPRLATPSLVRYMLHARWVPAPLARCSYLCHWVGLLLVQTGRSMEEAAAVYDRFNGDLVNCIVQLSSSSQPRLHTS